MTTPSEQGRVPEITAGMRLDIAIKSAGLKVTDLADELGIDRATVSRWINDRHKRPVPSLYLKTIALRCGVPYEWLRTGATPEDGTPITHRYLGDKDTVPATVAAA